MEHDTWDKGYKKGYEDGKESALDDIISSIEQAKKETSLGEWEYIIKPKIQRLLDE